MFKCPALPWAAVFRCRASLSHKFGSSSLEADESGGFLPSSVSWRVCAQRSIYSDRCGFSLARPVHLPGLKDHSSTGPALLRCVLMTYDHLWKCSHSPKRWPLACLIRPDCCLLQAWCFTPRGPFVFSLSEVLDSQHSRFILNFVDVVRFGSMCSEVMRY